MTQALAGASSVCLTDLDCVTPLCKRNVSSVLGELALDAGTVTVSSFLWGSESPTTATPWDVVLGADLVYKDVGRAPRAEWSVL